MSCIFGNISNGVLNMHLLIKDVSEFIYLSVNGAAILLFVAVAVQVITYVPLAAQIILCSGMAKVAAWKDVNSVI